MAGGVAPLAQREAAFDAHLAALAEVLGAGVGLPVEGDGVDVGGRVAAVVDGDAHRAEGALLGGMPQVGLLGEAAGDGHGVHLSCPFIGRGVIALRRTWAPGPVEFAPTPHPRHRRTSGALPPPSAPRSPDALRDDRRTAPALLDALGLVVRGLPAEGRGLL